MASAPTMALAVNPMHAGAPMRALLTAMQAWITTGVEPPASRVPMRAHGTLVEASDVVPRGILGLPYGAIYTGASFTDPSVLPAKVLGIYPMFVPRANRDGMAISGIRMLPLAVPRATYTGWNPRAEGFGAGTLFPLQAAVVPFVATRAEREASGDPRPSLAERYADSAATSLRCGRLQRGWLPSDCCCRRTPSARSSLRRRTGYRSCTDGWV
jgi:hypothetical protein